MTEQIDPATLAAMTTVELAGVVDGLRRRADALASEGIGPDPVIGANLQALGAELTQRRRNELAEGVKPSELLELPNSVAPGDYIDMDLHIRRLMVLREWARELGIPFSPPPGMDLSDEAVFEEVQIEFYSYGEFQEGLRERQRQGKSTLAGMDTIDRFLEALRRALASGRVDDAISAELSKLFSKETLKWLPFLVGLGVGLGMLGAAGAFALFLIAYGPLAYELIEVLYNIANAETEEEFDAAVEALITFLGKAGSDIFMSLAGFAAGKAARGAMRRMGLGGTPEPPPRGGRRVTPRAEGGPPKGRQPALAPRARPAWPLRHTGPYPRKRPPWLSPENAPRPVRRRARGLSREGAALEAGGSGPRNPGRGLDGGDITFGPVGNVEGKIQPDGSIMLHPRWKPIWEGKPPNMSWQHYHQQLDELLGLLEHEFAHRRLRPHRYPPAQRQQLAQRLGWLLERSHFVKAFDETYAYSRGDGRPRTPEGFIVFFAEMLDNGHLLRSQYGVKPRRVHLEMRVLLEDPYFRNIFARLDEALLRLDEGAFDLPYLVHRLELFYLRFATRYSTW